MPKLVTPSEIVGSAWPHTAHARSNRDPRAAPQHHGSVRKTAKKRQRSRKSPVCFSGEIVCTTVRRLARRRDATRGVGDAGTGAPSCEARSFLTPPRRETDASRRPWRPSPKASIVNPGCGPGRGRAEAAQAAAARAGRERAPPTDPGRRPARGPGPEAGPARSARPSETGPDRTASRRHGPDQGRSPVHGRPVQTLTGRADLLILSVCRRVAAALKGSSMSTFVPSRGPDRAPVARHRCRRRSRSGAWPASRRTCCRASTKAIYTPVHRYRGPRHRRQRRARAKLTGRKEEQKLYRYHSGYDGGLREERAKDVRAKHPRRLMEEAVRGMLPKSKMGDAMYRKLNVYEGARPPARGPEAGRDRSGEVRH